MPDKTALAKALRANAKSAGEALDKYVESAIDANVYHALHESNQAAQAALDAFRAENGDDDELPPVVGENYRDGLARMLRNANPRFE